MLSALNERIFHNDGQPTQNQLQMVAGALNGVPEDRLVREDLVLDEALPEAQLPQGVACGRSRLWMARQPVRCLRT